MIKFHLKYTNPKSLDDHNHALATRKISENHWSHKTDMKSKMWVTLNFTVYIMSYHALSYVSVPLLSNGGQNSDQPSFKCISLHEILNLKKNMVITGVLFTNQKKCPRLFFTKTMTILGCKSPFFGLNVKWQPLPLGDKIKSK